MNKYRKIYKLNIFNQLYSPIILFFYITIFVNNNNIDTTFENIRNTQIFAAILLFFPILILVIINIFYIFKMNEIHSKKKILLLLINFLPLIVGILMLILNNYFFETLDIEFDEDKVIKRNTRFSSIFLLIMILFAVIYSILDVTIKNTTPSQIFALLFVLSIFIFLFSYFILIFYLMNSKKTIKEKFLMCIPFFNLFYKS